MSTSTTAALQGTGSGSGGSSNYASTITTALQFEDFHISSSQLVALLDSKQDAIQVLKTDLMDELNKEVKALDEDSWMFEGPRSEINRIAKPGSSFLSKNDEPSNKWSRDFLKE